MALILEIGRKQEPPGSTTSWTVTTNDGYRVFHMHNDTSGSNWIVGGGAVPISLPYKYNDTNSGISFLVESDGRHITATSSDGKKLWHRDPFTDAHLEFYRTTNPQIVFISSKCPQWIEDLMAHKGITNFVEIEFNSTQFGTIEEKTGKFTWLGQD